MYKALNIYVNENVLQNNILTQTGVEPFHFWRKQTMIKQEIGLFNGKGLCLL